MGDTIFKRFNQGGSPTGDIPASQVKFTDNEDAQTKVTGLEQNVGNLQTTVAGHTTAIAELQAEIEGVIGAQTNFVGIVASTADLPTVTEPSWGLVGTDIDALNAYVWNGTAWAMFGTKTYDFTEYSPTDDLAFVAENGFFIVDENLNIGIFVDSEGVHAKNILHYEIVE